jgi:hypothetical protein
MKIVAPPIKGFKYVVIAKNQPQYHPLPALVLDDGGVISRWKLNLIERLKVLCTGNVYLELLTFHNPVQPQHLTVNPKELLPENGRGMFKGTGEITAVDRIAKFNERKSQ